MIKTLNTMIKTLNALLLLSVASFTHAQSEASFALSTGAVMASDQLRLYAANPDGKVLAINAENGRTLWTSQVTGRPLAVFENQLVVVAQTEQDGENAILLLNLDTGANIQEITVDIGAAQAVIVPLPNQTFATSTEATKNGIRVYWEFDKQPLQGAAMFDEAQTSLDSVSRFGAFDLNLTAELASVRTAALNSRDEIPRLIPNLPVSERLPSLTGEQFRSANSAHLQTNRAVSDARFGTVYRWSLLKATGEALGGVTLPYAYAPFSVRAAKLITQLPPYAVRQAGGEIDAFAARIVSFNLQTGAELWSIDVLDPVYRGVLPP